MQYVPDFTSVDLRVILHVHVAITLKTSCFDVIQVGKWHSEKACPYVILAN